MSPSPFFLSTYTDTYIVAAVLNLQVLSIRRRFSTPPSIGVVNANGHMGAIDLRSSLAAPAEQTTAGSHCARAGQRALITSIIIAVLEYYLINLNLINPIHQSNPIHFIASYNVPLSSPSNY